MIDLSEMTHNQYNNANKERARENRLNPTDTERILRYEGLHNKKLWYTFLRQKMMDSFILDFYCSKLLLGIEIDWGIHKKQKEYDEQRDEKLRHLGIKIIRYTNNDVLNHLNKVISDIKKEIEIRRKELER